MRSIVPLLLLSLTPALAQPQDLDGDGLSDAMEVTLGMDADHADVFELIHDDKSKDEGDTNIGREIETAGDFTKLWFCAAARDRYVWKIEFTKPWVEVSGAATILYVDADKNRDTGRRDKEFARGVDMMLRPNGAHMIEWPARVRATSASEGNVLYLVADIKLNQEEGKSVYRAMLLTQDTREGRRQDTDSMSFIEVAAAGRSDRPRIEVAPTHPLYRPPEIVSDTAVRMLPGERRPTAEVTWITSWPCESKVEYGQTEGLGETIEAEPGMQNHRVFIPVEAGKTYHFRVTCTSEDGEPKPSKVMSFRADTPRPRGSVERGEVPLTLTNDSHAELSGAPFLLGVPFPQGALGSVANIRVVQDGKEAPTQAEWAACWPDGTVRWALVQFLADCPADATATVSLEYGSDVRSGLDPSGPMLRHEGDLMVVNTGPLEAVIDRRRFNLFRELSLDKNRDGAFSMDEQLIGTQIEGGLYLVDAEGKEYASAREGPNGARAPSGPGPDTSATNDVASYSAPPEISIEENGPVRAVVKVRGHHVAEDGSKLFEYIVRLMFYRGHSFVRIFHTFGNDNVGQKMTDIAQMGIRLPLTCSDGSLWFVGAEFDSPDDEVTTGAVGVRQPEGWIEARQVDVGRLDVETSQPRAGQTENFDERAKRLREVIVKDQDADWSMVCSVADMTEQYPKGWRIADKTLDIQLCPKLEGGEYADADPVTSDRLYYYLRDGVYRLHRGISKTHEIHLGLAEGNPPPESFSAYSAYDPAACRAPTSWYAETGAVGLMTPRVEGEFEEYESFVERSFEGFQKRREKLGEYGMLNFGDWWGERGYNWGNVEYDTQHVMLMEYLRTGDRKFLKRGCEAAIHNRDVDGVHYAPNPRAVGTVIVHCMFHVGGYEVRTPDRGLAYPTGGFNRGHVWTRGLFDHYLITGDRRSLEWALRISDYLAGQMTVGFSVGNHAERDTAWPIFGVMAAYEATADPYYLNAAKLMIEDVIRRQIPDTGNWGFPAGYSKVEPKPIGGYAWCCGLLISALELYNRYVHDPRVDEVIVRAARWLVRDEWVKEKQGFRATSCPTFNKGTRPGGSCWSCGNAMLIAHKLTGEEEFLDIARRGFSLFIRGAQSMGKGVTQSICLGPETVWRFKQAGVTSLDPTPYLSPGKADIPRYLVLWPGEKVTLPVIIRSDRDEKVRAEARVTPSEGLRVEPEFRAAELTARKQEVRLPFEVAGANGLQPGETQEISVAWKLGAISGRQTVRIVRVKAMTVGDKVGLVASGEDFLGPALDKLGVRYERLGSLDEIGDYRALLLGTQAHSIDSVGLQEGYWKLLPWVRAGGRLLLSQLNDTGWERFFLPYEVIVDELDGESGAIVEPGHAIFNHPHEVKDASGVKMYDTFRLMPGDPWRVLVRDSEGGPAIAEAPFGKGKALIMQPSFERLIPGDDGSAEAETGWRVFQNVIGYMTD